MDGSGRTCTTPVADEEMLYVGSVTRTTGASGLLAAVRAGATGDISLTGEDSEDSFIAWSKERAAPRIASPLLYQGCLYILAQRGGIIRCLDAKSGDEHYRERLPGAVGFTASPWASDGKVFCLDEDGQTVVLEAGPTLKVLATNKIDEMFWSSPAVIGNICYYAVLTMCTALVRRATLLNERSKSRGEKGQLQRHTAIRRLC